MSQAKKLFLDYGGLIAQYDFNRETLARAHGLALTHLNSLNGHRVELPRLAQAHDKAIRAYLEARGDLSEWPMDKIMGLMIDNLGLNGSVSVADISEIYKLNDHDSKPMPHALAILPQLAQNMGLGIISNLPHDSLVHELGRFGLRGLFSPIVVSYQAGFRKPHPAIYQEAMRRAGLTPQESVFISHDEEEVIGAERVGMKSFLVKSLDEIPAKMELLK